MAKVKRFKVKEWPGNRLFALVQNIYIYEDGDIEFVFESGAVRIKD